MCSNRREITPNQIEVRVLQSDPTEYIVPMILEPDLYFCSQNPPAI